MSKMKVIIKKNDSVGCRIYSGMIGVYDSRVGHVYLLREEDKKFVDEKGYITNPIIPSHFLKKLHIGLIENE